MPGFRKVLVANRGEIAVRVIRACRELGIRTVAIASRADQGAPHTELADEVHDVGGPKIADSYLNLPRILEVARQAGAEAIHPGYGMFAENAAAARQIGDAGLVFIGPPAEVIALMGDKVAARRAAQEAGVPVAQGSEPLRDADMIRRVAGHLGYPVIVKPVAGGGGIGMAIVLDEAALDKTLAAAQRLAQHSFGNAEVYIERYVPQARHIEVQLLADHHGAVIHMGERDCTVQRRYQKLIEETPSSALTPPRREAIIGAAVRLAEAVGYRSAGTMEFLVAPDGAFYFMEMNTRIQVEHPVTEMVTGLDIVREQIRIAAGERLAFRQEDVRPRGHAIECRVYAEDYTRNFLPSVGTISRMTVPEGTGVRVDSGVRSGSPVSMYYDPLLCKVVVWDQDRSAAVLRMRRALAELQIEGVKTTRDLHLRVLEAPEFLDGRLHTRILEEEWLPRFLEQVKREEMTR